MLEIDIPLSDIIPVLQDLTRALIVRFDGIWISCNALIDGYKSDHFYILTFYVQAEGSYFVLSNIHL